MIDSGKLDPKTEMCFDSYEIGTHNKSNMLIINIIFASV